MSTDQHAAAPRLLSVTQVQERLNVGRSTALSLMYEGVLRSVKIGSRRLVPEAALADYIAGLDATA